MKHTKGEWIIEKRGDITYISTEKIIENQKCPIATIWSMEDGIDNDQRVKDSKANAKLIVAAPELLKALEVIASNSMDSVIISWAIKAIKKATE